MKLPPAARWLLLRSLPPGVPGSAMLGDFVEELGRRPVSAAEWRRCWVQTLSLATRYGWRRALGFDRPPTTRKEEKTMWLESLRQDARFALRSWRRSPGFATLVVLTLTLGIGASTAIYSLVYGIVLRPLPYRDPDRLVFLGETQAEGRELSVSWPDFLDWRARQRSFEALALSRTESFTWTGIDRPQRLRARRVTGNLFDVLGVRPLLGQGFTAADDAAGTEAKAIVSHAFWQQRLGADPAALGRTLVLDGRSYAIVGVLPAGFRYLGRAEDLYVPIGLRADNRYFLWRGNHQGYYGVGRLADGVSLAAARTELRDVAARIASENPITNAGIGVHVESLQAQLVSEVRPTLLVLLGAVGCLLLIACVNVANLLVARGAAREREFGVRAALGGVRRRLIGQLLVESSLVAAVGAVLGVLLAFGLLAVLVAVAPAETPRLAEVRLDGAALLFALSAAVTCGFLFGAIPAFQAASVRVQQTLVRTRSSGGSVRSHRLRRGLMVVEVALALVLLVGAGLMIRTLGRLSAVDAGFRSDHLLLARFTLGGERWRDAAARASFLDQLLENLRSRPGLGDSSLAESLPIEDSNWSSGFVAQDRPAPERAETPSADFAPVSAGYFETLGIPLVGGRRFDATDTASSSKVVVVNEALARRIWPGEEAVGRYLKQGWSDSDAPWRRVVGVVADVKSAGLTAQTPLQVYMPISQEPPDAPAIVVRTALPLAEAQRQIEDAVRRLDDALPLYDVRTMDELLGGSIARQRMAMLVLLVFAAVALTLAAVGLYGVVSHSVTERRHEIGVRMALGAEGRDVLRLVVRQGLATALVGAAIGLVGAVALSRTLRSLLFEVSATDPATLAGVALMLLAVSALACYVPARRAVRVDPTQALRVE